MRTDSFIAETTLMKTYSYKDLAAAYVCGEGQIGDIELPEELTATPLEELSEDQKERLVTLGKTAELKMHSCL